MGGIHRPPNGGILGGEHMAPNGGILGSEHMAPNGGYRRQIGRHPLKVVRVVEQSRPYRCFAMMATAHKAAGWPLGLVSRPRRVCKRARVFKIPPFLLFPT